MQLKLLENKLLEPSDALISDMASITGDIMLLGAGGKMGPSMAKLAKRSIEQAGVRKRVIAVSRFSEDSARRDLQLSGIETIAADLLDEAALNALPDTDNVVYLAGQKFGTTGREPFTWAMNTYLSGRVAERFRDSRIVVFSTGNVYPFARLLEGGLAENHPAEPIGEYGQSCLGRERIFQHFSQQNGTPILIYRLNYAIDLRYGVLLELAKSVLHSIPIDLSVGHVNVIWQGDANEMAIRSLLHCTSPATILNVTGPETISVRWLAHQFGKLFQKEPLFVNEEQPSALLSNAAEAHKRFGYPRVTLMEMIEMTASWLTLGGEQIDKPTHFQERKGRF
ncbi:Nucleoside-diphosphate-sugar epimerase [Parapedobacter composti]|uniref:Nucleoside-diphosphate-sugar epimerase n=2 Tax=Parapedobacter composti TaxID=623281 RepID=A0A1I1E6E8_9SPHI|nr:Nucleoside-diphosphate-sugar epimerase [Parapedobacter composti]